MNGLETKVKEEYMLKLNKVSKEKVEPFAYEADKNQIFTAKQLEAVGACGCMEAFHPRKMDLKEGLYYYAATVSKLAAVCGSTAISYHVHMMCMRCLAMCAGEDLKEELLDKMAAGDCIAAFALTEPHAGSDSSAICTTAKQDGDDFIINGQKKYIMNIMGASVVIIVAKAESQESQDLTIIALPLPCKGVSISPLELTGVRGSGTGTIVFDNCRVNKKYVIGEPGKGYKVMKTILNFDRLGAGLLAIGTAKAALDIAVDYSMQRQQFGKPISSFQGVQFDVASMVTQIKLNETFLLCFLDDMAADQESGLDASIIKLASTDMAADVTMQAILMLGAVGYESKGVVERMHREVISLRIGGGTTNIQKQIIGKSFYKSKKALSQE